MFIDRKEFAKLLQDNESEVYWRSDKLQSFPLVHTWTHEGTGAVILREYWHKDGEVVFWACDDHFKG